MMRKKLILAMALITASAFSVSAIAGTGDKMAAIDTNGDGAISAE